MTGYGKRIKALRKAAGQTQTDLAELLHVAQRTVANWEGETREPGMDIISEVARIYSVTAEYIITGEESPARGFKDVLPHGLRRMEDMPHHYVPMLGKVAAGVPLYMETNYDLYVDSVREADFALTVSGDSMAPTYLDGDVVYVKSVPDVDDGAVCVVAVDDSATLKHLYHVPGGVMLTSDNPAYMPMTYTQDNCDNLRVLGVPVGFTRLFKRAAGRE